MRGILNTTVNLGNHEEDVNVKIVQKFKETYPIELWKSFGVFDEDYLKIIDIHWLKFLPPDKTSHYILAGLYILIMITGLSGNSFVILMFLKCSALRKPANFLIFNLAISDTLMMSKMPIFIFNSIFQGPALGMIGCHIYGFVGGLSGTVSICTLCAISIDRYYVIKFPLNMRFTKLRAKICILFVWCYGAIFSCVPLFNSQFGSYVPEGYLTSCSFNYLSQDYQVRLFIFVYFVAAWLVPFFLIVFCYVNILRSVLNTRKLTRKDSESFRHVQTKKFRQEVKLATTIFLVIVLWFIAWTPYAIVALIGIANRADLITPLTSMIPALFCKIASCIDPFVYAITNAKFKSEVRTLFARATMKSKNESARFSVQKQKSTKRSCYTHSCQASMEVEEELIPVFVTRHAEMVHERSGRFEESFPPKNRFGTDMVTGNNKPGLWSRPNFSNQKRSFKNIATKWMIQQRQNPTTCDYCQADEGGTHKTSQF